MGIIENKVRDAFESYDEDRNIYKFAKQMAEIGDYSVRCMHHWYILVDSIEKVQEERTRNINRSSNFNFEDIDF